MRKEMQKTVYCILKKAKGKILVLTVFAVLLAMMGIMESKGFSVIALVRYAFGNSGEPNAVIAITKTIVSVVYTVGCYCIMASVLWGTGEVLSDLKKNFFKSTLFYLPVSFAFDYLLFGVNGWMAPMGYAAASMLVICKNAVMFLIVAGLMADRRAGEEMDTDFIKAALSRAPLILSGIVFTVAILLTSFLHFILAAYYHIGATPTALILWLPGYAAYSAGMLFASRIIEAILTLFLYMALSANCSEHVKTSRNV